MDGHWKFRGGCRGRGSSKAKTFKEKYDGYNWSFLMHGLWGGGGVFKQKNHLWGPADYGYFLELHNLTLTSATLSSVV